MPSVKGKGNGGKRPGAGRKSKAEEAGLAALIDACWPESEKKAVFKKLVSEAKKGNIQATQILLNYRYGKPADKHEHGGKDGGPIVLKVVYE